MFSTVRFLLFQLRLSAIQFRFRNDFACRQLARSLDIGARQFRVSFRRVQLRVLGGSVELQQQTSPFFTSAAGFEKPTSATTPASSVAIMAPCTGETQPTADRMGAQSCFFDCDA